ncbi:unannotated protein [freshwater metagenome]|uniref:Unannotated protein n=1 Tax=freshwater metagenome TaxID=449393 RepID=A0A6J7E549_9ZZZZ|nr:hypothetical protein [Actinomycetota bacterium]
MQVKRWVCVTAFALIFTSACIFLARWQLNRQHGRNDANAIIESNYNRPSVPLDSLITPGNALDPKNVWRTVSMTGRYDVSHQLLVRRRSLNESTGFWVLTPLQTKTSVVWCVRGWIPAGETATTASVPPKPPVGEVAVTGHLRGLEKSSAITGLPKGQIQTIDSQVVNIDSLGPSIPAWLQVSNEKPAATTSPTALPAPDVSAGPHLGYAIQWVIFACLSWVAWWILLLRRDPEQELAP